MQLLYKKNRQDKKVEIFIKLNSVKDLIIYDYYI